MVIERPFRNAKTSLRGFMDNRKRRGMRFHASALSALAERSVKDEFGVTEFCSQSLGTSIKFPVEDEAASGAVFDGHDDRVFQSFCHPEPVFGQGDKVGIVFDENRNFKFGLQQLAKVDIRGCEDRTPESDAAMRIDESRQPDADS